MLVSAWVLVIACECMGECVSAWVCVCECIGASECMCV